MASLTLSTRSENLMRKILLAAGVAMSVTLTISVASAGQHSVLGYAPMSDEATNVFTVMFLLIVVGGALLYHYMQRDAAEQVHKALKDAKLREEALLKKMRNGGEEDV